MSELTAARVDEIYRDCLFESGADTSNMIKVEGVGTITGFDPDKIDNHRNEIIDLLHELPDTFRSNVGGGWSFLNGCMDRNDRQWTGDQLQVDQLMQLGMAIKAVTILLPRDMWSAFPGGVPYFSIDMAVSGS